MTTLSSAGWIVHDVGLATAIGGSLFGKVALEPALDEVSKPVERDQVAERAWDRFSWINLAGHVAFAVPWLLGRKMLSGKEVSMRARALTQVKDVLVGVSLLTGVSSFILGKMLSRKVKQGEGPEEARRARGRGKGQESRGLEKVVATVGMVNMIGNAGILAVTSLLAMESSESFRFSVRSRLLP